MSTAAMMAVSQSDIPFESEDEIATRLAHYEEQFSNRYTEEDDWYAGTCQRTGRWRQVPVMSPWPPRRGFAKRRRYDDRRGGYHSDWHSRDRSDHGYHSQRRHEGHTFGRSRSPRRGYYGSGYQQSRSPHRSPRGSSWGEQGHHGHSPLSPSSHDHTHHPPPPSAPVSHTDHTLYPDDEPPMYHSHHEKQSARSRSRSPGSYPWQTGDQQLSHRMSPGNENEQQIHVEQLHVVGGGDSTTSLSQSDEGKDALVLSETNTPGARVKAPPPPPLDLGTGEEEEHAVPSKSDVMDILSVASKGANDVTAENLKQVQRETQIQAARKTMKNRQKQQRDKTNSGKSNVKTTSITQARTHKGRQTESVQVTHGHTKNVSQSRLLEGGTSLKSISKTHALLQESIAGGTKELSTTPIIPTFQRTKTAAILASEGIGGDPTPTLRHGESITTKSKKGSKSGKRGVASKAKQKRHKVTKPEQLSSSENEELDVVTPDSGNEGSRSISLNNTFKSESSHVQVSAQKQRQGDRPTRGNVRLSSEDLASDNSDEAMDATLSIEPLSLYVKINRNLISYMPRSAPLSVEDEPLSPTANVAHDELEMDDSEDDSDSLRDSPRYALEYSPSMSTRMVIRTNLPQQFPPSESEGSNVIGDSVGGGVERDMLSSLTKAVKKKKKKHKHKKVKMGAGDLKMKISLN